MTWQKFKILSRDNDIVLGNEEWTMLLKENQQQMAEANHVKGKDHFLGSGRKLGLKEEL